MHETALENNIDKHSRPSDLRITDLRIVNLRALPFDVTLLRLDTNQGLSGYGEARDGASAAYALLLKSRLLGENPCNIDKVFRKIKQFGYHGRQGGGICGVEMALFDLAGKAYDVPAYQLVGGKFRDKVLIYCDTESVPDGRQMGEQLRLRMAAGFKFLKMDLGISLLRGMPGALSAAPHMHELPNVMHPLKGIQITQRGIDFMVEYVRQVRDVIGYEIPLAVDHFGHITLESCIRLGQALDPFSLAWLEDMLPWQLTEQYRQLKTRLRTPLCTGEDVYLKEGFLPLLQAGAVSVIHPDLATSGGIMETKKIGDLAQDYGVAMAMHFAGSPVSFLANVHCAAATENFYVLEHHSVDLPWWEGLIDGIDKPLVVDGYAPVPEAPGLGFGELNEAAIRERMDKRPGKDAGYFAPTDNWNEHTSHDRLWS
ncbi:MAG: mandelate racemase/muconate lactonizing enzyme family protein [Chloroflexota bacterium]|nr:mandelate racemase/muconate lactonizing enzyme family protein [Chloroflexota bacterium]MDE2649260.1 mandelate racemase/muconate lactonizing enzyme family protein [Chloroflexota bacterium]